MNEPRDSGVEAYLDEVCRGVRAQEMHGTLREELADHLRDIIEEQVNNGADHERAVANAIARMGDPQTLGKQLDSVHRPRIDWHLLAWAGLLACIGLTAMVAVQIALPERGFSFFSHQAIYTCLGVASLIVMMFTDYRRLRRFSWWLFGGTLAFLGVLHQAGELVNGAPSLVLSGHRFDVVGLSPYLLVAALAGIMQEHRGIVRETALFVAIPILVYASLQSYSPLALYLGSFVALYVLSKRSKLQLLMVLAPFTAVMATLLSEGHYYLLGRLRAFLHYSSDPLGAGYMLIQSWKALQAAGWWGNGFGTPVHTLPSIEAEMVFPYLVFSWGWIVGCGILVVVLSFLVRLVLLAAQAHERYGKLLISGMSTLICIQFVWNLLMTFGLLPIVGMPLPLISYGGMGMVCQMAAIGLMLGIYRRQPIMPRHHKEFA